MKEKESSSISAYSSEVLDAANDILQNGDSFKFIVDTWNRTHVGDRAIGESCACAVAATYISNTYGLHIKPSGTSGKGKSDAMLGFLTLLPEYKYLIGSLSGKAMFYNEKLKTGTIVYTDDVKHNEDVVTMIKTATTLFQDYTTHHTVKNQTYAAYTIPPRITWWMTSVDGFDDDQMSNRFLGLDVDDSAEQDLRVAEKHQVHAMLGITSPTEIEDVLVSQCVYDILGKKEYNIVCPFSLDIEWNNPENRRNLNMFHDILRSVTFYNVEQREQFNGAYLSTTDDFYRAKQIYKSLAETNATNLGADERKIMQYLSSPNTSKADIYQIGQVINKSRATARRKIQGVDGNGGLLAKIPGLRVIDRTELDDGSSDRRIYYSYQPHNTAVNAYGLSSYQDVVVLNGFDETEVMDEFKTMHSNPHLFI